MTAERERGERQTSLRGAADVGPAGAEVRGVAGHSPSCPHGEVLTQEPEEVRRAVLPQAGMGPVLGRFGQHVVPHLECTRADAGSRG